MSAVDAIISQASQQAVNAACVLRFGRVKSIQDLLITVELAGTEVPGIACLSSYSPKVGDWAWLLHQGAVLVAVGCSQGTVNEADRSHHG